jgi:hypothetical protein
MKSIKDLPGSVYTIDRPLTKADKEAMQKFIEKHKRRRSKVIKKR